MAVFPEVLKRRLANLEGLGQRRVLAPRQGIDFSSNDTLGLSSDPVLKARVIARLKDAAMGSTGSRLLRGHSPLFEDVERRLAWFSGADSALVFPSGYQANLALLSSILTSEDFVFSDQLNHASLIDGMRLSRAHRRVYPHRNVSALRRELESLKDAPGIRVIVTESLFGMDGTLAPLSELADLAEEFSACLIVDEAHATGLWGDFSQDAGSSMNSQDSKPFLPRGGGRVQALDLTHRVFATLHTGGKALGVGGAWISGSHELKEYLVNFSRPFIFSTAPIPALAIELDEAIGFWTEVGPNRAASVLSRAEFFRNRLSSCTLGSRDSGPIVPVILGSNERATQVAFELRQSGFDIRAIRPPTVPVGSARLRICIHWDHTENELDRLAQMLIRESGVEIGIHPQGGSLRG